jgi:translation initiation factor 5A
MKKIGVVKDLKKGKYVIIDGIPCRVVNITTSKPGKHGAAKARVDAVGVFTGQKKTLLKPVDSNVEIPLVERKSGQVIADVGANYQVMDLENYETFEVKKPDFDITVGGEVEYMEVMGQREITRAK